MEEAGRAAAAMPPADALRAVIDVSGLRRDALWPPAAARARRGWPVSPALERLAREIADAEPALDARGLAAGSPASPRSASGASRPSPPERVGVQVMTVHQAKGLEFDAVFVIGMIRSSFPGVGPRRRRHPGRPAARGPPEGPRRTPRRGAAAGVRRDDARPAPSGARRLRRRTRRASPRPSRPSSRRPAPRRAPTSRRSARRPSAPCWRHRRAPRGLRGGLAAGRVGGRRGRRRTPPAAIAAAEEAARDLIDARAAALRPAPPPEPVPAPARPARPGLELSPSAVEAYRLCPLRYRFAMVDRVPVRPSSARAIGVAAHAALEAHYRPGGTAGDGEQLVRRFAAALRREGVAEGAEGRQALARAGEALPAYHERMIRSRTRPVAVEREFTLTVGPHRVRGRVDRVDAHPAGGHQLVDYKTGKPPGPGAGGDDDDMVMRLYLVGARGRLGHRAARGDGRARARRRHARRPPGGGRAGDRAGHGARRRRGHRRPAASSRARRGRAGRATSPSSARRRTDDAALLDRVRRRRSRASTPCAARSGGCRGRAGPSWR